MNPRHLLRLYPRRWRERYGDEFIELVRSRPLSLRHYLDIIASALDAWLSADVRRVTTATPAIASVPHGEKRMRLLCDQPGGRFSIRDGMQGAAAMIAATLLFVGLAAVARQSGAAPVADALRGISFSAALLLSLPFWILKGQPWKAQAALIGTPLAALLLFTVAG